MASVMALAPVALCTDVGISAAVGAAMLSMLLGCAFLSRQIGGLVADRIGGLRTIFAGSVCQLVAMVSFLATQSEAGLFTVSAVFGLGFSGIIPGLCAGRARAVSGLRSVHGASQLCCCSAARGWPLAAGSPVRSTITPAFSHRLRHRHSLQPGASGGHRHPGLPPAVTYEPGPRLRR